MNTGLVLRAAMALGGLRSAPNGVVSSTFSSGHMTLAKTKLPVYIDRKIGRMIDERSGSVLAFKQQFIDSFDNIRNNELEAPKYTFAFCYDKEAQTLFFKGYIFRPKTGNNGQPAVEVEDVNYHRDNVDFPVSWYVITTVEEGKVTSENTSVSSEDDSGRIVASISDVLRAAMANSVSEDFKQTVVQMAGNVQ